MTTETVLTENIANIIDPTAGNLEQAVRDAIDGYESERRHRKGHLGLFDVVEVARWSEWCGGR